MEDILASIKRIIAEDNGPPPAPSRARRPVIAREPADPPPEPSRESAAPAEEAVLELTEPMAGDVQPASLPPLPPVQADPASAATVQPAPEPTVQHAPPVAPAPAAVGEAAPAPVDPIVSDTTAVASRHALAALSALVIKPSSGQDNTLDGLVREMLRPMMKEWLDANLPDIVEAMVAREIQRITGRAV